MFYPIWLYLEIFISGTHKGGVMKVFGAAFASLILALLMVNSSYSEESSFLPNIEPSNIYSPLDQLGLPFNVAFIGVPPSYMRRANLKAPGDYFRSPEGINSNTLSQDEINIITNILKPLIKNIFYDQFVLDSLKGYQYHLYSDSIMREDFFIRYSQGDTIYVISGWVGKFLSFYRAVPGIIKYDHDALQKEIFKIAVESIYIPQEIFNKAPMGDPLIFSKTGEKPYFIEYVDKEKMIRVRCYQISEEIPKPGQESSPFNSTPRTLIEITKFLDKDVMP
jgi:hypothetical protein